MPPAVRVISDKWFVRADGPESFLRQKCRELQSWIDVLTCHGVYHAGTSKKENPHTHIIMTMSSTLQKQSFDIRIKKLFEVVDRNAYSTKAWDGAMGEGAGSYLYHESNDSPVLCNKGFDETAIDGFKTANASVQRMVAINNEKANTKLVGLALEEFKDSEWNAGSLEFEIFKYMLKRTKDGDNYHPGEWKLKAYVQEVHLRLCPDSRFDDFAYSKYEKIFR